MYFLITAIDRVGALDRRLALRPAHLDYWQGLGAIVKLGGPLLDGDTACGSMLLIEATDATTAQAIADGDPFAREGVFERVEIKPTRLTLGIWQSVD